VASAVAAGVTDVAADMATDFAQDFISKGFLIRTGLCCAETDETNTDSQRQSKGHKLVVFPGGII